MSDNKLDEIEQRKKEIEAEIEEIESSIDQSIDSVKGDVSNYLNPKNLIKDYPLQSLGVSILVGYLIGNHQGTSPKTGANKTSSPSIMDLIWQSIKKDASEKIVKLASAYLDAKSSEIRQNLTDTDKDKNGD